MNVYMTSALRFPSKVLIRNFCTTRRVYKPDLPRLPVPALPATLKKYLKSVKPFLNKNELLETETLVKYFGATGEIGSQLQCTLEEIAKDKTNWLERWWLNTAYLEYRNPLVFYSSPGLVLPHQKFKCPGQQFEFAARLVLAAVDYKFLIDNSKIPVEMIGKQPLDMSQYGKIFGTCRIPNAQRDFLVFDKCSKHIIVIFKNNLFKMDVISGDGSPLNEIEIMKGFDSIVEQSGDNTLPIGILTADYRDNWACAYEELNRGENNRECLAAIASSLFTLCLDMGYYTPPSVSPSDTMTAAGYQSLIGGGPLYNIGNRWFDKTVQFVVDERGHNGITYEHSPAEGQPIAVMADHIVNYIDSYTPPDCKDSSLCRFPKPRKLKFEINDKIRKHIKTAEKNMLDLLNDMDVQCFKFDDYGKEFIKSKKMSPDSYIQMAIQLAFYRIHGVPGAHYESASTRMFIGGRTETIRSCSEESVNFCKTMLDPCTSNVEKQNSLKTAITAHKDYTMQALKGLGIDRHLLGLRLVAKGKGIPLPDFFKDVAFTRSSTMRISTSQVASKSDSFMVFGPITNDGYACCYNPRPKDINFGTSTFRSCPDTSAVKWKEALIESLVDMRCMLDQAPRAKL